METLEELKEIISLAPEGETMIFRNGYYLNDEDLSRLAFSGNKISGGLRSLSDIKRIIELMDQVKSGYEAYARIEAVKQRYNGESKRKTNILIGAEKLLKGCNTHNCLYLANVIKGALK